MDGWIYSTLLSARLQKKHFKNQRPLKIPLEVVVKVVVVLLLRIYFLLHHNNGSKHGALLGLRKGFLSWILAYSHENLQEKNGACSRAVSVLFD